MSTDVYVPIDVINRRELDELLERKIEQARVAMTNAQSMEERREAYEEMRWLISQRSNEQIARMEKERGLA